MVNADKPDRWAEDFAASKKQYNEWFFKFAPDAFRSAKLRTVSLVEEAIRVSDDLAGLAAETLREYPHLLSTFRMCCCPPIARDRIIGLAGVPGNLVYEMEKEDGPRLPPKMAQELVTTSLQKVVAVIKTLLDDDLFPWLTGSGKATEDQRRRAAYLMSERLCSSFANPTIRNAQEKRQKDIIREYLVAKGYREARPTSLIDMAPRTFWPGHNVAVPIGKKNVNVPVDVVIAPPTLRTGEYPIMVECKSAGDETNVNKRRKEEGHKGAKLRAGISQPLTYLLFLCGYFGPQYLQHEADDGFDWVWEHRVSDFDQFGL